MALRSKHNQGFTIIEVVTVILIIGVGIFSLVSLGSFLYKSIGEAKQYERASLLASEGLEAVRGFRDNSDWNIDGLGTLATGAAYHPEIDAAGTTTDWQLLPGPEIIDGFRRQVILGDVSRDPVSRDIESVYDPAHYDGDSRRVLVRVHWKNNSISLETYLTNWRR